MNIEVTPFVTPSRWFFRGYSKALRRFLSPEELARSGVYLGPNGHLNHSPDIILAHWTGKADQTRTPLFEHDVVEFDQITEFGVVRRRGVMRWFENPGHYSIAMPADAGTPGTQFDTQNVRRVGSVLEDPELPKADPSFI